MNRAQEQHAGPHGPLNSDIQLDRMDKTKLMVYGVGMFSGVITVLFPLSVIKTKQMASPNISPGFSGVKQVSKQIMRSEGISGFYRGYGTILMGAIPMRMVYLPTYEYVRSESNKALAWTESGLGLSQSVRAGLANGIGGGIASLVSSAIVVPVDVVSQRVMVDNGTAISSTIKTTPSVDSTVVLGRTGGITPSHLHPAIAAPPSSQPGMMAGGPNGSSTGAASAQMGSSGGAGQTRSFSSSARALASPSASSALRMNGLSMTLHILRTEGIGGLYRGLGVSLLTHTPSSALWWSFYSTCQSTLWRSMHDAGVRVKNNDMWTITGVQALSGLVAGCSAAVLTTPLDVVKTRLQVAGSSKEHAHLTAVQMMKRVYRSEGLGGFWRGVIPRAANVALWGTCMVTTYEVLKRLCVIDDDGHDDRKIQ